MESFATTKELEARWRPLTEAESKRAETLLADASVKIALECEKAGVAYKFETAEEDALMKANLSMVACEMVKRAMLSSVDQAPVTQQGITVGPFNGSLTFANPTGDLYLTKAEMRSLGIRKFRIGTLEPVCKWGES